MSYIGPTTDRATRPGTMPGCRDGSTGALARALEAQCGDWPARELLRHAITTLFPGRIAIASSFGAESAVLLHMAASVDPAVPVLFLDTGKHFAETLAYRDRLARQLGLTDIRAISPDPSRLRQFDADGRLWSRAAGHCCWLRKVEPLRRAIQPFDAWVTGRKAHQTAARAGLPVFEADGDRIKVNPLARWHQADVDAYFVRHDLPRHPLEAEGFSSIGCSPCTAPAGDTEDRRAGRWPGSERTECGIHWSGLG